MGTGLALRGYYAILDVTGAEAKDPSRAAARATRLLAARPCMIQVRAKEATAAELAALARAVLPLAREAGVPLCVNDRLDVALAVGAEAVHLGQDDLPLADARRIAAGRLIIGVSTHDAAQAAAAVAGGADYLGFGPVFPTSTKADPDPTVGLTLLHQVAAAAAPTSVVAIGGVTPALARSVAATGATAAAVISAIDHASDPTAAARSITAAFAR
jgi:thiamine-phosphate pyrophosphorylase